MGRGGFVDYTLLILGFSEWLSSAEVLPETEGSASSSGAAAAAVNGKASASAAGADRGGSLTPYMNIQLIISPCPPHNQVLSS